MCTYIARKGKKMKKRYFLIFIIAILVFIIIYYIANHISITKNNNYMDYNPEQEISDSHSKETTITLYFLNFI